MKREEFPRAPGLVSLALATTASASVFALSRTGGLADALYAALIGSFFIAVFLVWTWLRARRFHNSSRLVREDLVTAERAAEKAKSHAFAEYLTLWVHEVKTPLATLRLVAARDTVGAAERRLIDVELDRLEDLTKSILFAARAESFAQDYLVSEIDLRSLVVSVLQAQSHRFIVKDISVELGDFDSRVLSDPKWLGFVLEQIFANCIAYTPRGGRVTISARESSSDRQLEIADSGIGIPPEDIPRVFDRGFTGKNGRSYTGSTGMGLYFAKRLLGELGHRIEIESERGTTVTIVFPKHSDLLISGNLTKL